METIPVAESILHQLSEEQEQEHNNMATINYPLTKTVLSAEGSAEVIAYGSNDYTNIWSVDTNSNWSLWDTFPTVVRFGNFVYCWHKTNGTGSDTHTYYILIDVVEDPSSNKELGRNIAYPELSNTKTDKIENISTGKATVGDLTDGPYNPLLIGDKVVKGLSPVAGFPSAANNTIKYITPVFTNGAITTAHIGGYNAAGSDIHRIRGWGDISTKKGTNGVTAYGLFAPFATQAQFETVYGKEHNWQSPITNSQVWLFEAEAGSGSSVYATALTYPFTVEAMVSNTLYRDIPGDTNGDGDDDTPSYETALSALAVVAAVVPALDPTKCVGFPGDIKIPGIATDGISKRLKDAKAAVAAAASSTGLLDIEKSLEGFKASIEASLPKGAQILNLAADMANVNPDDFDAIDKLNEKWKGAVDNVAGYFDDIGGLDICSLVGLEGKAGADGKLVKKPELPNIPESDIEEPEQSVYVPVPSKNTPQDARQAATGYTPAEAEKAKVEYNEAWKKVRFWETFSLYMLNKEEYHRQFDELYRSPNYQKVLAAVNRKEDPGYELTVNINTRENRILDNLYIATWITKALAAAQLQITNKLLAANNTVAPGEDPSTLWTPPEIKGVGSLYTDLGAVFATIDETTHEIVTIARDEINAAIKEHILNEEILTAVNIISTGSPSEYKRDDVNVDFGLTTEEGDPAYDRVLEFGFAQYSFVDKGEVKYIYSKHTIRNRKIQPALMHILQKSAGEKGYCLKIFSGGQPSKSEVRVKRLGDNSRVGSKRHDDGYAVDIEIYDENGRYLSAKSRSAKDMLALQNFVDVLLKNGIGSVGADNDYMNGNMHIDIAHVGPQESLRACWGQGPKGSKTIYAPSWLTSVFEGKPVWKMEQMEEWIDNQYKK
jgi:hypothetical protein